MAKMYYEKDCDLNKLTGKTVAVIGYGSQGHAHALNLRDSGVDVIVGLRKGGKSWPVAVKDGFDVMTVPEAAQKADIIMILINDERQADMYKQDIAPYLTEGKAIAFAHGFNIRYKQIVPPAGVDVFMAAPKGPGHTVRSTYVVGKGVPCLVAVEQDASGHCLDTALAYIAGIGGARAGIMETTMHDETETDLFGEQAVLCGGIVELMRCGFETLVEAGYEPENAYFECIHEMKLIVDLINKGGVAAMNYSISDTAEYGEYVSGPRILPYEQTKANMKAVLNDIQDGTFAGKWIAENKNGRCFFNSHRDALAKHPMEVIGKQLREQMLWKNDSNLDNASNSGETQGALPLDPTRGSASGLRQGRCPCTLQGTSSLDPFARLSWSHLHTVPACLSKSRYNTVTWEATCEGVQRATAKPSGCRGQDQFHQRNQLCNQTSMSLTSRQQKRVSNLLLPCRSRRGMTRQKRFITNQKIEAISIRRELPCCPKTSSRAWNAPPTARCSMPSV